MHNPEEQDDRTRGTGDARHLFVNDALAPNRTMEERMYGDVGHHIKEVNLEATLDHLVAEDKNLMDMDRASAGDEIRRMMSYLDLDQKEATQFVHILNEGISNAKPDEWAKESRTRMNRVYGSQATKRLNETEKVVQRNWKLNAFIREHKLGSHPDLVELIARKAPDINRRYE
ncbi:MAG: hypothetical protein AB2563_03530 [Candidatus Thiodiazotropha endolucinida]